MALPRAAIVTAAGGGIGAAVARELAAGGIRLALMSRSAAVEALARELDAVAVRGSVTEAGDLERLAAACRERYGRIDAVVNHTGHPPKSPLLEIPDRDWHAGLDMLVLNVVRICRLVTPVMIAQGGGAIVNVSTFATFEPEPAYRSRHRCGRRSRASPSSTPTSAPRPASASTTSCPASSTACRTARRIGKGCRRSGSAPCWSSPRRSPSCCPTAPATSPGRTSASTAA
jgi:NAD(P)-dependent dehydrogenase (short-subunit alcohol dehydrogenase family)